MPTPSAATSPTGPRFSAPPPVKLKLVLADDWELRGDGSGNPRALQFSTLRRLLELYERHDLRGTVNVEVLQQLAHLEQAQDHPELRATAEEWVDCVVDAYRRGHD